MSKDRTETASWPIDRLKPHPAQDKIFRDTPEAEFEALQADIKKHGLRHRVEILPDGTIVCGHRRVRALRMLDFKKVPVLILHGLASQGEAAVIQRLITDNALRRQLTPLGKARCYLELSQQLTRDRKRRPSALRTGELREQLGKILNLSGRNVDRYLAVARLPMPIQQAFDTGGLSLVEAARVATLAEDMQKQIAAAVEQGVPARNALAGHLPVASNLHRKVADAIAAFVRNLERGIADLDGRVDLVSSPRADDRKTLETAKRLIDQLLDRTRCPA